MDLPVSLMTSTYTSTTSSWVTVGYYKLKTWDQLIITMPFPVGKSILDMQAHWWKKWKLKYYLCTRYIGTDQDGGLWEINRKCTVKLVKMWGKYRKWNSGVGKSKSCSTNLTSFQFCEVRVFRGQRHKSGPSFIKPVSKHKNLLSLVEIDYKP